MTPDDFHFLTRLLRRRSGLSFTVDKLALVERRLTPVMRRFDFKDMTGLIDELRLGREALADAVTEAMTVNESSFFRDAALFQNLRESILPRLVLGRARSKRLRIWSAACAAGQEAYSIAILLTEMGLAREGWNIDLVATDLSGEAIQRAEAGRYAPYEIERGLDAHAMRYFRRDRAEWLVDAGLRSMVSFRRFNLLDSFGWLDEIDLVFCRNVLMYFDPATRVDVLERMADTIAPDGLLLLGENETPSAAALSPARTVRAFTASPASRFCAWARPGFCRSAVPALSPARARARPSAPHPDGRSARGRIPHPARRAAPDR
jgi:chemotaxis protein methyltransferase CheR